MRERKVVRRENAQVLRVRTGRSLGTGVLAAIFALVPACAARPHSDQSYLLALLLSPPEDSTGGTVTASNPAVPHASCAYDGVSTTSGGPTTGKVLITEVGYKFNLVKNWLEIHNGTDAAINLSDYNIRVSNSWSTTNGNWGGIRTYTLPSLQIPKDAYVLLRASYGATSTIDHSYQVSVAGSDTYAPFWGADGFIELLSQNATVDFVRFGTDSTAPISAGAWTGAGAVALTDTYSASLKRNASQTDTNAAADWTWSSGITPFLPNENACSEDADADGIPDCAELPGRSYYGLPYYHWGARQDQRDMFIEIDYMAQDSPLCLSCPDGGLAPDETTLNKIRQKYAAHGIAAHFDVGDLYDGNGITGDNPERHDLCNAGTVPFETPIASVGPQKAAYMDPKRANVFHYVFYIYSDNAAGTAPGYAGYAALPGSTVVMATAQRALKAGTYNNTNYQSDVLFHELGHNLGLGHGGSDGSNYKPNYLSSMNYLYGYGFVVLGQDDASHYYYYHPSTTSGCSVYPYQKVHTLSESPDAFPFDYSDGSSGSIDENAVSEAAGVMRAGGLPIDFNCNGSIDSGTITQNLDSSASLSVVTDHNDWAAVQIYAAGVSTNPWSGMQAGRGTRATRNPFAHVRGLTKKTREFVQGKADVAGIQRSRDGALVAVPRGVGHAVWMDAELTESSRVLQP